MLGHFNTVTCLFLSTPILNPAQMGDNYFNMNGNMYSAGGELFDAFWTEFGSLT